MAHPGHGLERAEQPEEAVRVQGGRAEGAAEGRVTGRCRAAVPVGA